MRALFIILLLLTTIFNPSFSQTEVGAGIKGEASFDQLGYSVSLSAEGNRIAIGAPGNDENGDWAGHVRVHEWNGVNWTQMGADIDGEASNDFSGYSVSISANGDKVAIGAYGNDENEKNSGQVRVYKWNGNNWLQLGTDIHGEAADDHSGVAVSLSADGKRVAIGAPNNDKNGVMAGQVRIYEWNGIMWIKIGIDIDGENTLNFSGASVSLSADGSRVAIGEYGHSENGGEAGQVRIFELLPISPNRKDSINISPNPTSGKIDLPGIEYQSLKIIDNMGRIVWQENTYQREIDISELPRGIYFLRFSFDGQVITSKIVKD